MEQPLVTIVITTKNEEHNIENCIRSIKLQSYSKTEIIVVDNNSDDRTQELARQMGAAVYNKGPERSAQRNYGMIDKSSGKYVMFIDCDMILSPGTVESCVEKINSSGEKAIALHIPEIVLGKKFFSKVRRYERSFYDGTPIDGARFFDKSAFVQSGGFDEKMYSAEDWDLDKRIKQLGKVGKIQKIQSDINSTQPWFDSFETFISEKGVDPKLQDNVIYHNESEFNLKSYIHKKKYYTQNFDYYFNKWGKDDPDIKKQFGFGYRFFGVFLENGKWKRFLLHPILSGGMYFLRVLVGIAYLTRKKSS